MKRASKHFLRVLLVFAVVAMTAVGAQSPGGKVEIKSLSTDPSRVTGGDVLLQITLPDGTAASSVKVAIDSRDVTGAFKPAPNSHALMGVVTGLTNGRNLVTVRSKSATPDTTLEITNYPITGPVFSGPWIQPFICQTDAFKLPDGTTLGKPLDENCSAKTVVQYVYRTTGATPEFKPLPAGPVPADMAKTTTTDGKTVNFIVRVETGTMDRGIYQNTVLFDPATDPAPTPFTPPAGWNHRLIAVHGTGCPGGWYIQGPVMGVSPLDAARLGEGYAYFVNTLNHPTNSCNAIVAGEASMMGKEHFIEEFGVPFYTISVGTSGGAYTSLQVADAFPGLFDGISINLTFPDALDIAWSGLDAHLLAHYFQTGDPGLTDPQKVTISGYAGMKAFLDAANQSQRTDPIPGRQDIEGYRSAMWNNSNAVPDAVKYDPVKNPKGARPTIYDVARNVYGVNPTTGAALRPYDNVGVQYGLNAFNEGAISFAQFITLNEKIGGVDQDGNYTATRAAGDPAAIKRTYQSGLLLSGKGGLASIPIFDNGTTNEQSGYHYGWFHFAVRDRLRQANGNSDNFVMWRNTTPAALQEVFDKWMVAYKSDKSNDPQIVKVLRNKPKQAVEGCYDTATPPNFIAEALSFTSKPTTKCSTLFPVYSNPRHEAGGPLAANVLKCQLKPVDAKDYKQNLSAADIAKLKSVFKQGVCDWSKPGVNQQPVVTWASWGPNPKNLLYDVSPSLPKR